MDPYTPKPLPEPALPFGLGNKAAPSWTMQASENRTSARTGSGGGGGQNDGGGGGGGGGTPTTNAYLVVIEGVAMTQDFVVDGDPY